MTTNRDHPGSEAGTPAAIPPRGWWQVIRRAFAESSADNVSILAGGVAFFTFLSLLPALIAALTLYGLVADPATVARQVQDLAAGLPQDTQSLAGTLQSLTTPGGTALGVGLVVSTLLALWSASGGVQPDVRDQLGLRRGRDTQLPAAARHSTGADPRRDRVRAAGTGSCRGRAGGARRAVARRSRHRDRSRPSPTARLLAFEIRKDRTPRSYEVRPVGRWAGASPRRRSTSSTPMILPSARLAAPMMPFMQRGPLNLLVRALLRC